MTNKEQGATMTQGQSEQSAKYKVGDKVKFDGNDYSVVKAAKTRTGRWLYTIERKVACIAVGVTENMLDPADEDAQ